MKYFATLLALAVGTYDAFFNPHQRVASNDRVGQSEEFITASNSAFFSEEAVRCLDDPYAGKPGEIIAFSNDGNLDAVQLNQPLNEFVAKTVEKEGMLEELNALAPIVPVGRRFSWLKADQLQDFQQDSGNNQDVRQIGEDFATQQWTGTQVLGETINKGLRIKLDHDQNGRDPSVQQTWVKNLTDRLIRSEMLRVVSVLSTNSVASTYSSGSINWGKTNTTADPDNDLMQLLQESGDSRGIDSNLVMMAGTNWTNRFSALANTVNPALTTTRTLTPEQLAAILNVDDIHVSKRRYQFSVTTSSGAQTKKQILGSNIYFYYAQKGATTMDPSNIKRFTTAADGLPFRVYTETRGKFTIIQVEHYSTTICTSTLGMIKCAITYT